MAKKKTDPKKTTALVRRDGLVPAVARLATEIRDLIETARHHVSVTANLTLVNLYWNIGHTIAQDIQRNEKRAGYGEQVLEGLSRVLTQEYGAGYSRVNLQEMRRFSLAFEIRQTVFNESRILRPAAVESSVSEIRQPLANESTEARIREPLANELLSGQIPSTAAIASPARIIIDFRKHFRLGWTHYRMLLSISDPTQRRFYFEQAASQHWSKREFRRQIERGLFERVALSKNIPRLVAREKPAGPAEMVRYEDIFKDPYVLDFLGLKGAYSERDLEAAIVRNLEQSLSELGTDFCFIGRQYAMRIAEGTETVSTPDRQTIR